MGNKKIIISTIIGFAVLIFGSYSIGAKISTNNSSGAVKGAATKIQPEFKEFNIVMKNNRYSPSIITVNENDRVVINFTNEDNVAHGVGIAKFNASVPGGHVRPGQSARMEFIALGKGAIDAATCGGPNPTDKTDDHGEELIINVI